MSKRILVIDDDELVRESFKLSLDKTEYEVHLAESGEKGIEMVKTGKYDLIFLDLKMPGMNGVETLRILRNMNFQNHIYILTAFHETYLQELEKVINEGIIFDLLKKPLDRNKIA